MAQDTAHYGPLNEIVKQARERFDTGLEHERDNFNQALEDLEFLVGDQWDAADRRKRLAANQPVITVPLLQQYVNQVVGDMRENRPSIKVVGVGGKEDADKAEILEGLIRSIEEKSQATRSVYIEAGKNGVACGQGHWRVDHQASDDDYEDQELVLKPIRDALAVLWDPDAKDACKRDAEWCFVLDEMTKDAFEERWPKKATEDFAWEDFGTDGPSLGWFGTDTVRIAEYWVKKPIKRRLAVMIDGRIVDVTDFDEAELPPDFLGRVDRFEKRESHEVCRYLISGREILEGPDIWPGKIIPIVTVIGQEYQLQGRTIRHGLVRHAKDTQRLLNYWKSVQAEVLVQQPKAPYLISEDQIKGHEAQWKLANVRNFPALVYRGVPGQNPPQRAEPPLGSQALFQEALAAKEDLKSITGIYDAGLGARSNETSGIAITARQRESDVGTNLYLDNLALAIEHTGRILIELIPKFYDGERVVRLLHEDGEEESVLINQNIYDEFRQIVTLNDMTVGRYDVRVVTGPSYTTKRVEAAQHMVDLLRGAPQLINIIGDLAIGNLDWPNSDELVERLRKLAVQAGVAEPRQDEEVSEQEQAAMQQANMLAQLALDERIAGVIKTKAEADEKHAKAQELEVETAGKALELQSLSGGFEQLIDQIVRQKIQEALAQGPAQGPPTPSGPVNGSGQPAPPTSGVF